MAIEDATDLAAFFDVDEFGVAATIGGGTVNGILDNGFAASLDMEGSQPRFTCASADVAAVAFGDTLTIAGATYSVRGVQADGQGVTVLVLEAN